MKNHFLLIFLILTGLNSCRKDHIVPVLPEEIDSVALFLAEGQTNWTKIPFYEFPYSPYENVSMHINEINWIDNTLYFSGTSMVYENDEFMTRSNDTGKTWIQTSEMTNCGMGNEIQGTIFLSSTHGFAAHKCGAWLATGFYETTNGGSSWNGVANINGVDNEFRNNLKFHLNDDVLFMDAAKSTDGGQTWSHMNVLPETSNYFFTDTTYGICVTQDGVIAKTTDMGENWDTLYHNSSESFNCVTLTASGTILVGGKSILRSTDGGTNWSVTYTTPNVRDIEFVDENIGFAATLTGIAPSVNYQTEGFYYGDILKTTDGGQTWTVNYHSDLMGFNVLQIIDDQTILAAGSQTDNHANLQKIYFIKTATQGN